jgi:hypothetical protein
MIFTRTADLVLRAALLVAALTVIVGLAFWWYWPRSDYRLRKNWPVAQTVPFSHQHHVSGLGIDCRFCHSAVEVSSEAGMPPTDTCMTCHSQVWTQAQVLAPVRASLRDDQPLVWQRVTDIPDYVYFNHGIHLSKGVGCSSCHGDVGNMPLSYKAKSMTMQFCLDCHKDPGPQLRPRDQLFNTRWQRASDTPSPAAMLQTYQVGGRSLTDCSICHR